MLKRTGGVSTSATTATVYNNPIRWFNIYNSGLAALTVGGSQPIVAGTYYIQYPKQGVHTNVTTFDTSSTNGVTRVMFYAFFEWVWEVIFSHLNSFRGSGPNGQFCPPSQ